MANKEKKVAKNDKKEKGKFKKTKKPKAQKYVVLLKLTKKPPIFIRWLFLIKNSYFGRNHYYL